jgi:hypothetical protein
MSSTYATPFLLEIFVAEVIADRADGAHARPRSYGAAQRYAELAVPEAVGAAQAARARPAAPMADTLRKSRRLMDC